VHIVYVGFINKSKEIQA